MIQLIKTQDKFILVSDEKLVKGDKSFDTTTDNGLYSSVLRTGKDSYWNKLKLPKIIAGIPSLPSIDFSLLKEEDCKEIGFIDVEKLRQTILNKYIGKLSKSGHSPEEIDKITERDWFGLWEGFQIAQSLNDKMFSLVDVDKAIEYGHESEIPFCKNIYNEFIQSLQQAVWGVEVEMGYVKLNDDGQEYGFPDMLIPKITNGSIKITKILWKKKNNYL